MSVGERGGLDDGAGAAGKGAPMYCSPKRGVRGYYYRCSRYVQRRTCPGVHMTRALAEARVALWLAGHVDKLASSATAARDRTDEHARAERLATEHRSEVQRLEAALVSLATGLAEGLVDPAAYATARTGLLDRRDTAKRDLQDAEADLARLAPLPKDVYDRLVAATDAAWTCRSGQHSSGRSCGGSRCTRTLW